VAERQQSSSEVHADLPRFLLLFTVSILGMAMLGAAAFAAAAHGQVWYWWEGLLLAATVGGAVGFLSSPFVVLSLKEANLWTSLPTIYGVGLVVTVIWSLALPWWYAGLSAAIPAYVTVSIMARWCARRFVPNVSIEQPQLCPECHYDLRDRYAAGCPECGWGREQPST
jgi:hypothetical protein